MSDLKPCPFCGGGTFDVTEVPLNKMPSMDGRPSSIVSASVRHWCPRQDGQPGGLNVSMHGRDRTSAIAAWNRRSPSAHELALAEAVGHIALLTAFCQDTPGWQHGSEAALASEAALEFIGNVPIDWKAPSKETER